MKERPILMTGPLVVATMKGLKNQTRRVMQTSTTKATGGTLDETSFKIGLGRCLLLGPSGWPPEIVQRCPYGVVGDRLWVRETFCYAFEEPGGPYKSPESYLYRADGIELSATEGSRWLPSIHMPRRASRLTLEITEVRVQRLQDITAADVIAEGISVPPVDYSVSENPRVLEQEREAWARCQFVELWDRINGERLVGGKPITWKANPWVWVIGYRVAP